MTVFSLTMKSEEAPIQVLKGIWGPVRSGEEPWRTVRIKSRVMPGTSMAYNRSRGEVLAISLLNDGGWNLRMFKESPYTVEEALRRGTSRPHSWEVVYHGHDAVDAARAFVRWCLP